MENVVSFERHNTPLRCRILIHHKLQTCEQFDSLTHSHQTFTIVSQGNQYKCNYVDDRVVNDRQNEKIDTLKHSHLT